MRLAEGDLRSRSIPTALRSAQREERFALHLRSHRFREGIHTRWRCFNPGILPKCVHAIFNTIQNFQAPKFIIKSDKMNGFEVQSKNVEKITYANDDIKIQDISVTNLFAVFATYLEIYNNTLFDLLDDSEGKTLQTKTIREDCMKNMYVSGIEEIEVKSAAEASELFHLGQSRKRTAQTNLNAQSSRSHCIFKIRVVQLNCQTNCLIHVGQLSLVDLAGSERANRTQATRERLREASCVNKSLMSLRSCLEILRDNQLNSASPLVPYRDSRLTHLLKNFFEGERKVEMIVCGNPLISDYDENTQVMKFADIAKDVEFWKQEESRRTPSKNDHLDPQKRKRANNLKQYRPKNGLQISLQQQPDSTDLDYKLVASLIANAFFSTFPKRTDKTHPTLQNDFSDFVQHLNDSWQKTKLKSVLYDFEWLDCAENAEGHMRVQTQVRKAHHSELL